MGGPDDKPCGNQKNKSKEVQTLFFTIFQNPDEKCQNKLIKTLLFVVLGGSDKKFRTNNLRYQNNDDFQNPALIFNRKQSINYQQFQPQKFDMKILFLAFYGLIVVYYAIFSFANTVYLICGKFGRRKI